MENQQRTADGHPLKLTVIAIFPFSVYHLKFWHFFLYIDMKQKSLTRQEIETIYIFLSLWFKTYTGPCILSSGFQWGVIL